MPFVKPMMTGRGKYLTAVPRPVMPRSTSRTPAIMVHSKRPLDAILGDDSGDDDDERARGSADLRLRATERGDEEAGDDRAIDSGLRRNAGGNSEGHRERQSATRPTVTPAIRSRKELMAIVIAQEQNGLWEATDSGLTSFEHGRIGQIQSAHFSRCAASGRRHRKFRCVQ